MIEDQFVMHDAAYVLGALSPSDRRAFEQHLKGCAACASSVGELAGLPGLMSKVPVDQLTAVAEPPPETLLPSLARAVRRERGRRRTAVGAVAAAAAALIGVGGVAVTGTIAPARTSAAAPSSTPARSSMMGLSAVLPSPVTARARLVDMAWGTRIDLTCNYDAKGRFAAGGFPYALVVIDREGRVQQVATWKALPGRELTVVGSSSLVRPEIAAVEIRTLSGVSILRLST
jgi:hypothetical protein